MSVARPRSEDKRMAILEAATEAIAEAGLGASTALIARKAGVAEGTIFRYFAISPPRTISITRSMSILSKIFAVR